MRALLVLSFVTFFMGVVGRKFTLNAGPPRQPSPHRPTGALGKVR
jgi:hypothetical protein